MSRAPTCGVRIASQQRVAHVISLDTSSYRFQQSAALLRYLGFAVRHFLPIPKDDPQVVAWEKRFQRDSDTEHSPRGSISLSLSHLTLWRTFPTDGEWLYVFEDDLMLAPKGVSRLPPPYGRGTLPGKLTWRWPADEASTADTVRCLLSEVEAVAGSDAYRASPMLYLGSGAFHHHHSPVIPLFRQHTVRMCDTLNLHAYAVRRGLANPLAKQLLDRKVWKENGQLGPYRYNLDVIARGFFMSGLWKPPSSEGSAKPAAVRTMSHEFEDRLTQLPVPRVAMPLCIDMEESGIIHQNSSFVRHFERMNGSSILRCASSNTQTHCHVVDQSSDRSVRGGARPHGHATTHAPGADRDSSRRGVVGRRS